MRYYNNFKSIAKKLISAVLVLCIVCAGFAAIVPQGVYENAYAAGVGSVDIAGNSFVKATRTSAQVYKNDTITYNTNIPSPPTILTVTIGTMGSAPGSCEIRLGDKNGEVLAFIDTKAVGSWAVKDYSVALDKEIQGDVTLVVVGVGGVCNIDKISFWLPGPNGGRYPDFPYVDRFGDIANIDQREEINMLNEIGVLDNSDDKRFSPNMTVTRADFAVTLSRLYNVDGGTYASNIFTDVPKTSEFCGAVSTLAQLGILKQNETKFRPYEFVTLNEAVEMILKVTGYQMRDNKKSMIDFADSMDLLEEVNKSVKFITKADMAALVYNAVSCDPAKNEYYVGGKEFEVETNQVLEGRSIYCGEGFLQANDLYSAYSNEEVAPSNSVIIDGNTYFQNECYAASSYVGMNVRYFYKKATSNSKPTILSIAPDVDVETLDLRGSDYDFEVISNELISYYESDAAKKPEEIELDQDTIIMYNDKLVEDDIADLLAIDDVTSVDDFKGRILLINNDGDKEYDVVKVYNSVSIIFGGMSDDGIYDILREETFGFSSQNDIMLYRNSVMTDFRSMIYGDAFDIYRTHNSKGQKIFKIVITTDVSDTVFTSKDGDFYVTDAGEKLEVYPRVAADFEVELGKEYSVQKNQFGQIIKADPYNNDSYGVLLDKTSREGAYNEYTNFIKVLDSNGKEQVYQIAEKAFIEGDFLKTGAEQKTALDKIPVETADSKRMVVVKYRLNDENIVTLLDSPVKGSKGTNNDRAVRDKMRSTTNDAIQTDLQPKNTLLVNFDLRRGVYLVAPQIVKFIQYKADGSTDYNWTIAKTLGAYDGTKSLEVFADNDEDDAIGEFVIQYDKVSKDSFTDYRVVESVSTSIDADGDEVTNVYLRDAKLDPVKFQISKSAYSANSLNFAAKADALKAGDVIQMSTDANKEIDGFIYIYFVDGEISRNVNGTTVYSVLNDTDTFNGKSSVNETISELSNGHMRNAEVTDINGNFIKIKWWIKNGTSFNQINEWVYCSSGCVTIISENDNGDIKIQNGKGVENFIKGDHVIIPFQRLVYSCSAPIILRTHDFVNPTPVNTEGN